MPETTRIVNTRGEIAAFSIDRYAKDAVAHGASRMDALAEARLLLSDVKESGVTTVTTDAIRHWAVERDPAVLAIQPPLLRAIFAPLEDRRAHGHEEDSEAQGVQGEHLLMSWPQESAQLEYEITVRKGRLQVRFGDEHQDLHSLLWHEAAARTLHDERSFGFLAEGFLKLFPDIEPLPGVGEERSVEEILQDLEDKERLRKLAEEAYNRLYQEILAHAGPAGIIEFLRRKLGKTITDLEQETAEKLGFQSAEQARRALGDKVWLGRLLKAARGTNVALLIFEVLLVGRLLWRFYAAMGELSALEVAIHTELLLLGNEAYVIDPGVRAGVGGGIGKRPGCTIHIEYITRYMDDKGEFVEETLSGPTLVTGGGEPHKEDVTVAQRGSHQFFIVRFIVRCPGEEERVLIVVRQAVRH